MKIISYGEVMGVFSMPNGKFKYATTNQYNIAGAESNTLIALNRLGMDTKLITSVGQDAIGESILYRLKSEGIELSSIVRIPGYHTGLMTKQIGIAGSIEVDYHRKHSAINYHELDTQNTTLESGDILYITGITPALSQLCKKNILFLIEYAKKLGMTIILDPNIRTKLWDISEARQFLLSILPNVDVFIPGKKECEQLIGDENEESSALKFMGLGVKKLVIKLGEEGAYYQDDKDKGYVKGFKVKEIDPVGAGDAFNAGIIYGLVNNLTLEVSTIVACALGAINAASYGDYESAVTLEQLMNFIEKDKLDVER